MPIVSYVDGHRIVLNGGPSTRFYAQVVLIGRQILFDHRQLARPAMGSLMHRDGGAGIITPQGEVSIVCPLVSHSACSGLNADGVP